MTYTIERLSQECHDFLKADPGPDGREKVCAAVAAALTDADFVGRTLPDDLGERHILFQDPELGFCILGHVYHGAKQSPPHDHGPTWAIYGQAAGETLMDDWELVEAASAERPGKVRHVRAYKLTPGMAYVYQEGQLHSPRRDGPTKLLRIEGVDVSKIKRHAFEAV